MFKGELEKSAADIAKYQQEMANSQKNYEEQIEKLKAEVKRLLPTAPEPPPPPINMPRVDKSVSLHKEINERRT
jgi:hypothetical protein